MLIGVIVILEGAVRKWVSSGLTPLIILIRDISCIWLLIYAAKRGLIKTKKVESQIIIEFFTIVLFWGTLQVIGGSNTLEVFLIGLRFWTLYLAIGIAGGLLINKSDSDKIVKSLIYYVIFTTPLIMFQFISPPASFINQQVDGEEGGIFIVAEGIVRTTGTFSFTLGQTCFLALMSPLIISNFLQPSFFGSSKRLAIIGLLCLIIITLLSGSRSAIVFFIIIFLASIISTVLIAIPSERKRSLYLLFISSTCIVITIIAFPSFLTSLLTRIAQASDAENLGTRLITIFLGDARSYEIASWLGSGIGIGSNLAAYVTTGERMFLVGESESGRILAEGGFLGAAYLAFKLIVILYGSVMFLLISIKSKLIAPIVCWLGFTIAFITWPAIGNLTANALLGLYVATIIVIYRIASTYHLHRRKRLFLN